MAADNAAKEQLIQSMVRLVDHFSVCDLKNDSYVLYNINERTPYKPSGAFHELCAGITKSERFNLSDSLSDSLSRAKREARRTRH